MCAFSGALQYCLPFPAFASSILFNAPGKTNTRSELQLWKVRQVQTLAHHCSHTECGDSDVAFPGRAWGSKCVGHQLQCYRVSNSDCACLNSVTKSGPATAQVWTVLQSQDQQLRMSEQCYGVRTSNCTCLNSVTESGPETAHVWTVLQSWDLHVWTVLEGQDQRMRMSEQCYRIRTSDCACLNSVRGSGPATAHVWTVLQSQDQRLRMSEQC